MHKVWRGVAVAAAAFALLGAQAQAANIPIPGKIAIVKSGKLAKLVAKPVSTFPIPGSVTTGSVQWFDTVAGAGDNTYALTAGAWQGLGNPAGSKGWKYKGTKGAGDPCVVVLIKEKVIKAICKGAEVTIGAGSFNGNLGILLNTDSDTYCATLGGTAVKNDPGNFKRKDAPAPGVCPTPPAGPSCCGPERIVLTSTSGTLEVGNLLPAFPFPPGVLTTMDVATSGGLPNCQHPVVVPAGGFSVPFFGIPALGYCSRVVPNGCAAGSGVGGGNLWDGNGAAGVALTNVSAVGDTADGVCDTTAVTVGVCSGGVNSGLPCASSGPPDCPGFACTGGANCTTGTAGANTNGDIDATFTASPGGGVRSVVSIPVHSLTWSDTACTPTFVTDCCAAQTYNPLDGDFPITEFDFILRPTTGTGTSQFVDKNANVCRRAGSGFQNSDGPASLVGTAAAGPCCTVGQPTTVVSVGIGFSGGAPLYDLGFKSTIPNTVASCGALVAGSCTVATDPCLF